MTEVSAGPSPGRLNALMLLVVFLMAVCYPAIKTGLAYAPPLHFAALRTIIAGAALLAVAMLARRPVWPGPRLARRIVPLGLVATAMTYSLMFLSPGFTLAGISSVLGNTQPLFIAGLVAAFLGEPLTRTKSIALGLGFLGVLSLSAPSLGQSGGSATTGALLAVSCSLAAAVASVWMKMLRPGRQILALTGWQLLAGGLVLLAVSAFWETGPPTRWSAQFVLILAFLSLGGTAAATSLGFWCLQHAEAGRLAPWLFLIPVLGVLLSVLWLGERPGPFEIGGMAAIAVSVALVLRNPTNVRSN